MSLVSTFVDAFKKAAGKQPKKPDIDEVRSSGGLGSTHSAEPFTPLRPAPESDTGKGIDRGDVSVGSSDPEEGGEAERPPEPGRI
jgi:hypothetical protein